MPVAAHAGFSLGEVNSICYRAHRRLTFPTTFARKQVRRGNGLTKKNADGSLELMAFQGLRVRMAIHMGSSEGGIKGPTCRYVHHLTDLSWGGMVLMSKPVSDIKRANPACSNLPPPWNLTALRPLCRSDPTFVSCLHLLSSRVSLFPRRVLFFRRLAGGRHAGGRARPVGLQRSVGQGGSQCAQARLLRDPYL